MAFDQGLAQRIRERLAGTDGLAEKQMFGGLSFLVGGNLCVGVMGDELMARVGRRPPRRPWPVRAAGCSTWAAAR